MGILSGLSEYLEENPEVEQEERSSGRLSGITEGTEEESKKMVFGDLTMIDGEKYWSDDFNEMRSYTDSDKEAAEALKEYGMKEGGWYGAGPGNRAVDKYIQSGETEADKMFSDAIDWMKDIYGEEKEHRYALEERAFEAQETYLKEARRIAMAQEEDRQRLQQIFESQVLPGIQRYMDEAFAGIPYDQAIDRASADVNQAFAQANQQRMRELSRMGIDPSSPAYQSAMKNVDIARSASEAGARNQARQAIRDVNFARRQQAAAFGMQFPGLTGSMTAQQLAALQSGYGGITGVAMPSMQTAAGQSASALGNYFGGLGTLQGQAFTAEQAELNRLNQQRIAREQAEADERAAKYRAIGTLFGTAVGTAAGAWGGGGGGGGAGLGLSPQVPSIDPSLYNPITTSPISYPTPSYNPYFKNTGLAY